jgi:cyclophilin family peptidyl-prolyl cis-trans isomerase
LTNAKKLDVSLYSLVIYQNDSFVDGLYQSMCGGKIDTSTQEDGSANKKAGSVKASGGANFTILSKGAKADVSGSGNLETNKNSRTTHVMSYTQSYYLHKVREKFYQGSGVKKLNVAGDFNGLIGSDFVEFKATFEKNDIVNVLDMITPQLGGVIGYNLYAKGKSDADFSQNQATGQFELGKSIVEALQKEFRNETSSEFYGKIIDRASKPIGVTAVLICDKQFFANADDDRILDGEFTVFGKVVAKSNEGLSKFERNKLLKRIKTKGKEWLVNKIAEQKNIGQYVDTSVELDIKGNVIKIIPIAIYT